MFLLDKCKLMTTVGKGGEFGKLFLWKFDHLEGSYDFSHEEIHKTWWDICLKCNYLPGKFTFFPALLMTDCKV